MINVAGHRLGTKEIESASITVDEIAEAAAVPVIDEIRGKIVEVYVALKPGFTPSKEIEQKVSDAIDREIGQDRAPEERVDRRRHAEDPLGQDHAPGDRRRLELRRRRRHDDARQPRDRRATSATTCRARSSLSGEVPRELSEQEKQEIAAFGHAE